MFKIVAAQPPRREGAELRREAKERIADKTEPYG